MDRTSKTIINGATGMLGQMLLVVLGFVNRKLFLSFFGVALLGINNTIAALLGMLSMAELGFGSAARYCLYKPLADKDNVEIARIMRVFRWVYWGLAAFIMVFGCALLPVLPYLLKDVQINQTVYFIFFALLINSAGSYLFSYKRTLIGADQAAYMANLSDFLCNLVMSVLRIVTSMMFQNFYLYLLLTVAQTFLGNFLVSAIAKRRYAYINFSGKPEKSVFKKVFSHVKHIFATRIASYFYSSTDDMVISAAIGTTQVGLLANYKQISSKLFEMIYALVNESGPTIGNLLSTKSASRGHLHLVLRKTYYARNLVTTMVLVPFLALAQVFVGGYYGEQYVMSFGIVILLTAIVYLSAEGATQIFITAGGQFRIERNVMCVSAVINFILSVTLSLISGVAGVLIGTVVAQSIANYMFEHAAFKAYLEESGHDLRDFRLRKLLHLLLFVGEAVVCVLLVSLSPFPWYITFVLGGVFGVGLVLLVNWVCFRKTAEFQTLALSLRNLGAKAGQKLAKKRK